jgi:glycosyltransferase involved in cell wall biosynthesis
LDLLESRRGIICAPRRVVDVEIFDRSLRFADSCSLIGNDVTLETFPKLYKEKINKVTVSASVLDSIEIKQDIDIRKKEFLWLFGSGAVHKGLDLVLEVFAKNRNLILHVVGAVDKEKDFFNAFRRELRNLPNIKYHGYLAPNCEKFKKIIKNVFCFIAPSCSEGISPSVATCLHLGLYPIISKNTGITLPEGCGIYLNQCSLDEIEKAVLDAYEMNKKSLVEQILKCQEYALYNYSRKKFTLDMTNFIEGAIVKFGKR